MAGPISNVTKTKYDFVKKGFVFTHTHTERFHWDIPLRTITNNTTEKKCDMPSINYPDL